ncbi:hypothetical protein [Pseudohoeflea coraliihabitans]|nr:hypothetical protein [Pseudohoeflea sp. DP4N28-3]
MTGESDRPFDWIAALAFGAGAAVIVPSLIVLLISIVSVLLSLF